MAGAAKRNLSDFLIRVGVVTAAALLILYAAKSWHFPAPAAPEHEDEAPAGQQNESADAETAAEVVSWRQAGKHIGEFLTVEGKIVETHNSGKACFLNFHPEWRSSFTAVIFARSFAAFPPDRRSEPSGTPGADPEDYYRGKRVRVTGMIREYRGKPEIILSSPDQIEVLAD